jgi:Asp-tRNA(Asn)/Glu-tRNA(Gln) amidotransferase A subunit family amidase
MKQDPSFTLMEATIDSIHAAMRAGAVTCRDLVERYIARIKAYDREGPSLHAVQTINPGALQEAERLDARFRASGPMGPLHGVPVLVKDQIETNDMPTTYGSALFSGFATERDATVVEKLKAAGAVIVAKTTMGEFAQGYAGSGFGVCRNPYDPTRDASGSSSGTGAALAANMGTVGIGEDTLGSIRGPAARGSLVGLRPTLPLVSRFGMMPATPTRDTLGPLARTVRDAAILLDVIAGYDPHDPVTAACVGYVPTSYTSFLADNGLTGIRLGIIREPMNKEADPTSQDFKQVRAVIDRAVVDLEVRGAQIVDPLDIPGLMDLLDRCGGTFETETAINGYLAAHPHAPAKTLQEIVLSPDVLPSRRARMTEGIGHTTSDPGYLSQLLAREALRQAVLTAMADDGLDALVYATFDQSPLPIPPDILTTFKSVPYPGNNRWLAPHLAYPAITVPAGFTPDGLPVGIEFLGRPFSEGTLFRIAYGYEQATHHRRPPAATSPLPGDA